MRHLRDTIHSVLAEMQHLAQDLLFDWWPTIELERIHDDLATHRPGFSFLSHPQNNLQASFRAVSKLAFSEKGGCSFKTSQGKARLSQYLPSSDRFVRLLYTSIHTTNGMPARGEEFRVIRWADTAAVQRNIFVYKQSVILVFAYNKANTNNNNSFYIVRSLCPLVQRALFVYIVYIRPCRNFVSRELGIVADRITNPHLFAVHSSATGCISSSMAHASLSRSTAKCPVPLTTSLYRQFAVSIAKKHLPDLIAPFDPNTPRDYNGFIRLLAFQTGHKPATHAGLYALEHRYPSKLQPDLIERYLENSHAWQSFTQTRSDESIDLCSCAAGNKRTSPLGYAPDEIDTVERTTPEPVSEGSSESRCSDWESSRSSRKHRQGEVTTCCSQRLHKRKRANAESSPNTLKIMQMQGELNALLEARSDRNRRR
jgi:hypothetical protein